METIEVMAAKLYMTHELGLRRAFGRPVIVCWESLDERERRPWRAVARRARRLCAPRTPPRRRPRR